MANLNAQSQATIISGSGNTILDDSSDNLNPCNQAGRVEEGFTCISSSDQDRWYRHPDQVDMLRDNAGLMYFAMKPYFKIPVDIYSSPATEGWYYGDEPIFRHNKEGGLSTFTFRYYPEGTVWMTYLDAGSMDTITLEKKYLPNSESIQVFMNGRKLAKDEYEEVDWNTIKIIPGGLETDVFEIQIDAAAINEGNYYDKVNANIVKFDDTSIFDTFTLTEFTCWVHWVNDEAHNPMKLLDKKNGTVVRDIEYWHPATGYHFVEPQKNVDLERPDDLAIYTDTPKLQPDPEEVVYYTPWGREHVGTVWFDTSDNYYRPYHDDSAIALCDSRIYQWGQLSDCGEVRVYEWVESNVHPVNWDSLAEVEEDDLNIEEHVRKSGNAWYPLFEQNEDEEWIVLKKHHEIHDSAIEGELAVDQPKGYYFYTDFGGDNESECTLGIFVNGIFKFTFEYNDIGEGGKLYIPCATYPDRVHIVRTPPDDPDLIEELLEEGILRQEYQYTQRSVYDEFGIEHPRFYFWVRNKKTRSIIKDKSMPTLFVERELITPAEPYMYYQNPMYAETVEYNDVEYDLPNRFDQTVVHGLAGLIDADDRYVLRLCKDFTLRHNLDEGRSSLHLKNLHAEWKMFRQEQQYVIDRALWDRVTECIIGRKITRANIRVPSYEKEIYDIKYRTDTRFGLGEGQAFTDGELAKASIVDYLTDKDNVFYPINVDEFFLNNSFDNDIAAIKAMDTIYSTFPYEHVNRMFFSVMHDAFAVKKEYSEIIKTSMVALHSISLLDDRGTFDD